MHVPGLYSFFRRHVQQGFAAQGLTQPALAEYVSELLTRFARINVLFPYRYRDGKYIETIAGLLMEWQSTQLIEPVKSPRIREAMYMRHIADYALFMSGVFRERLTNRGQVAYYREHGRQAFSRSARLETDPHCAALLNRVGLDFEPISNALDRLWHQRLPLAASDDRSALTALWQHSTQV